MNVTGQKKIAEFKDNESIFQYLQVWLTIVKNSNWSSKKDLKQFDPKLGEVNYNGQKCISFSIPESDYRIITQVNYKVQYIRILDINMD